MKKKEKINYRYELKISYNINYAEKVIKIEKGKKSDSLAINFDIFLDHQAKRLKNNYSHGIFTDNVNY